MEIWSVLKPSLYSIFFSHLSLLTLSSFTSALLSASWALSSLFHYTRCVAGHISALTSWAGERWVCATYHPFLWRIFTSPWCFLAWRESHQHFIFPLFHFFPWALQRLSAHPHFLPFLGQLCLFPHQAITHEIKTCSMLQLDSCGIARKLNTLNFIFFFPFLRENSPFFPQRSQNYRWMVTL